MIDATATVELFGCDPRVRVPKQRESVVVVCDNCGHVFHMSYKVYSQRASKYCRSCPEYKQQRSKIATQSNKNRPSTSVHIEKYASFVAKLRAGQITFTEISNELGVDDSTVCKYYHKNFGLKSKFGGKSLEEQAILDTITSVIGAVTRHVRYGDGRIKSDFYSEVFGHIEYDGAGFWHIGKHLEDTAKDTEFHPIRLNAQILFGGANYLKWKLQLGTDGYCGVTSDQISRKYDVRLVEKRNLAGQMLTQCHPLGNCAGQEVFGLFFGDLLIGVAKFGVPTNAKDNGSKELRRFFVLDGTPKNTESWFLRQCEKSLSGRLVTYIHAHERGSYLKALGWHQCPQKKKDYDCYIICNKIYSKRIIWSWAKRKGLVDKLGTSLAKEVLVSALGGVKITEPSKIKFEKILDAK